MENSNFCNSFSAQFSLQAINHPQQAGSPLRKFATGFVMDEYFVSRCCIYSCFMCVCSLVDWAALFHHPMKFFITRVNCAGRRGCAAQRPGKSITFFASCLCQILQRASVSSHRALLFSATRRTAVGATFHIKRGWKN